MTKDFIPSNDRSFLTWLKSLIAYIMAKGVAFFGIPDADFYQLQAETGDFEQKQMEYFSYICGLFLN